MGAQWGDEGKGKLVDALTPHHHLIVRYQGGSNAGHTIYHQGKKSVFHLLPSGLLHPHAQALISHGVVLNTQRLIEEIQSHFSFDALKRRLWIARDATVLTPLHIHVDQFNRQAETSSTELNFPAIQSTGQGIGPAYTDKVSRYALKLKDCSHPKKILDSLHSYQQRYAYAFTPSSENELTLQSMAQQLFEHYKILEPMICDSIEKLDETYHSQQSVLFEGGQGALLDIDYGQYPYVTSSSTTLAGLYQGAFIPRHINIKKIGVFKPYMTKVGGGTLHTLMDHDTHSLIAQLGNEKGATTGRPRQCGWLDIPLLRYAIQIGHYDELAMMKIDVLENLKTIKVCTAYTIEGQIHTQYYPKLNLKNATCQFKEFSLSNLTQREDLITWIENQIQLPITYVGTGVDRSDLVFRQPKEMNTL
jgi:adenylosuccinate synthase